MKDAGTTALLKGLVLGSVLGSVVAPSSVAAAPVPAAKLTLRPSYGGAVIDGKVYVPSPETLIGAWSSLGSARLMRCSPVCQVVGSLPMKNTTVLGNESTYRIVLGGQFIRGQRIPVTMRFRSGRVLVTTAVVNR